MRRLVVSIAVSALAACDHRPAPPPPPQPDVAPPAAPGGDGVQRTPVGDEACVPVAAKIADLIIAGTQDPTQKAAYEQDRVRLVKRFGDTCTRERWTPETRQCFLSATSTEAIEVCTRELARANGAAGSAAGSAAGPGSAAPH